MNPDKVNNENFRKTDDEVSRVPFPLFPIQHPNLPTATDQGLKDLNILLEQAVRRANVNLDQRQGYIFETVEAYKFNQDAALKGKDVRVYVTATRPGGGTAPHDAEIVDIKTGEILKKIQYKSSNDPTYVLKETFKIRHQSDIEVVTNKDITDRVKDLSIKRGQTENIYKEDYQKLIPEKIKGETAYEGVSSGGTTLEEVKNIAKNPQKYVDTQKLKLIAREVGVGVALTVGTTALLGTLTDLVSRGKVDKQTLKKIAKDSVVSGATSTMSSAIRIITKSSPVVASSLALGIVNTFSSALDLFRGRETLDGAILRISNGAVSSFASIGYGIAGSLLFGPLGGIVLGFVGCTVFSSLFGAFYVREQELRLLKERTKEIELARDIVIEQIRLKTHEIIYKLEYLTNLLNQGSSYLKEYAETEDDKFLDRLYEIFGWGQPPTKEEIIHKILSDEPIVLE
ncbi:MAG: hypothetical protein RMK75_07330 [Aquificaceae bacterium]|nr:hypothetical protein [Aquificaceae bacterium]MDW8424114.1 hypothetical protein [Aquificaceae bacterium]